MDDALAKGAKALTGGKKPDLQAPYDKGYFFSPTVLSDCTIDMKVSISIVHAATHLRIHSGTAYKAPQWPCLLCTNTCFHKPDVALCCIALVREATPRRCQKLQPCHRDLLQVVLLLLSVQQGTRIQSAVQDLSCKCCCADLQGGDFWTSCPSFQVQA